MNKLVGKNPSPKSEKPGFNNMYLKRRKIMKWVDLYSKLGKLQARITRNMDVVAIIDGKEVPLILKLKKDCTPYLISKEEFNLRLGGIKREQTGKKKS